MAVEELAIHVEDIGTIFEVTLKDSVGAVFPIDGATTLEIRFKKPDPTIATVVQTAVLTTDGLDGKLQYLSVSGDLDMPGDWSLQAFVITPVWEGSSSIGQFEVQPNL